jgi:hypothetical protein
MCNAFGVSNRQESLESGRYPAVGSVVLPVGIVARGATLRRSRGLQSDADFCRDWSSFQRTCARVVRTFESGKVRGQKRDGSFKNLKATNSSYSLLAKLTPLFYGLSLLGAPKVWQESGFDNEIEVASMH